MLIRQTWFVTRRGGGGAGCDVRRVHDASLITPHRGAATVASTLANLQRRAPRANTAPQDRTLARPTLYTPGGPTGTGPAAIHWHHWRSASGQH
ncbi:unnamed protein product [Lota lota]